MINTIEIKTGYLYIEDDIFCLRIKPDIELTEELVKEGMEIRLKLQKGNPMLALVDSTDMLNMTNDARKFIADFEREHNLNIALAIIANSLLTNMIANFFIKFNKPHAPTKLFKQWKKPKLGWRYLGSL